MKKKIDIRRGDIFLADFSADSKHEVKPVLVVQNDMGNRYSDTTIVAEMPDFLSRKLLPTHVGLSAEVNNLGRDAVVLTEHLITIKKSRLRKFIGRVDDEYMEEVDRALKISLDLE